MERRPDPRLPDDAPVLATVSRSGIVESWHPGAVAVWQEDKYSGALSFGTVEADKVTTVSRRVTVKNYGNTKVTLAITPEFRFANDEATGAVTVQTAGSFTVKPGESRVRTVRLTVDLSKLPGFRANSGSGGANAALMTAAEYDGYLNFVDGSNPANNLRMHGHVLPRAAANVDGPRTASVGVPALFNNFGAASAQVNTYSLLGLNRWEAFMNTWIELKRRDGTIDRLYRRWILGQDAVKPRPRWSIVRSVLHWVE